MGTGENLGLRDCLGLNHHFFFVSSVHLGYFLQVRRARKVALAGQGTIVGDRVLMPSIEHNTVASMDLHTLHLRALPPLPISIYYEAIFYLHF